MLKLSFNQTRQEIMVRAAATVIFQTLKRACCPEAQISDFTYKPQYGYTASAIHEALGPKFVRITDLQDSKINWDTVPYCECSEPENYLLATNDILFARTGATTGKTHLVIMPLDAVFASYLIRLRPRADVAADYLYAFFQSDAYWCQITDEKRGSAQPNVNGEKLAALAIPNVPRQLQHAIGHFMQIIRSRQDGGSDPLPTLPAPLQAATAVVAKLEELATKIDEATQLRIRSQFDLTAFVTSFHLAKSQERFVLIQDFLRLDEDRQPVEFGMRYPQVGVKGFGEGLFAKEAVDAADTTYKVFNRLYQGALVLSQVKGWEGAIAVCPYELAGRFVSPEYRTFRCIEGEANPEYLKHLVVSPWFLGFLKTLTRGVGARRERIRPEMFLNLRIPMPTIERQTDAIQTLRDVGQVSIVQAQTQAELDALLPSILDKAFNGEL